MTNVPNTPLLAASVEMIGHTGAKDFQLRYQDDEKPVAWVALAGYRRDGKRVYECAGALAPDLAAFRLLQLLLTGGFCTHCGRPTGVTADFARDMPLDDAVCWYRLDPELKKFRRSCEGDVP